MIKITREEMQSIYQFIFQSVYDLKLLTPYHDRIIVACPEFIIYFLKNYPKYEYRNQDTPFNELREYNIYGVKVQPHYANEVVVFYQDYHHNPEIYKPKIYIIKNEI
ncbi:MAG: hypothetical protein ABIP27_17530 [Flavobacterium circumlabens]|uniref:hypothetical protein n=1 Tax=Flavobacterium circumlabens TaxID=2133765 RepID=UPI00326329CA